MLTLHAPAKVNLSLRVLAREDSGFHQLETLFAALDFGDTLTFTRGGPGVSLDADGPPMGPVEENLVFRAANGFLDRGGLKEGIEIHLQKRIPVKSGLGGGSSDAAATLLGLDRVFPGALSRDQLVEVAGELGSDVPFFLSPSPLALGWGRGNRILPLPPLPSASVLLALPPVGVETPEAYRLLARGREGAPGPAPARVMPVGALSTWAEVAAFSVNDFENVIFPAYPILDRHRQALRETEPLISLLSGSGSALFALYSQEEQALEARDALAGGFPETRFLVTRTLEVFPDPSL